MNYFSLVTSVHNEIEAYMSYNLSTATEIDSVPNNRYENSSKLLELLFFKRYSQACAFCK